MKDTYAILWDYIDELNTTNLGTTVKVKSEMGGDGPRFQRKISRDLRLLRKLK